MMVVGLTGGIGSGKTTIGKMFRELGVPVYNSDVEAKKIMNLSKTIRTGIIELLGRESYINGELNRGFVAQQVFKNKELLQALNKIVHPAVREHFLQWLQKQDTRYVIQEAAIIFENGTQGNYDKIVLVTAPIEIRVKRVVNRDGVSESEVRERIQNQLPDNVKEGLSDFVIQNTTLDKAHEKVLCIHHKLLGVGA